MLSSSNAASFALIQPTEWGTDSVNGIDKLKTKFQEMGLEISSKTDELKDADEIPKNEYAILVGRTNRPASETYYESLRIDGLYV